MPILCPWQKSSAALPSLRAPLLDCLLLIFSALTLGASRQQEEFEFQHTELDWPIMQERVSASKFQEVGAHPTTYEHCAQRRPFTEPLDNSSELETAHVLYAANANNFDGLLSSMISLAKHLIWPRHCVVHIIVPKHDLSGAEALKGCFYMQIAHVRHYIEVKLHEEQPIPFPMYNRGPNRSTLTFARVFVSRYLPTEPRALWLDTDTIIKADVSVLYRARMQHPVAAVRDIGPYAHPYTTTRPMLPWIDPFETLFNAGVLLIDLERWRTTETEQLVIDFGFGYPNMDDQEILNVVFRKRTDFLSWKWNLQSLCFGFRWPETCLDQARILHFTGHGKPWQPVSKNNYCMPHADEYKPSFPCSYTAKPPAA